MVALAAVDGAAHGVDAEAGGEGFVFDALVEFQGGVEHVLAGAVVILGTLLVALVCYVIGLATASAAHKGAAALLLGGPYTALFWGLTVGLGIVIPLVIQTLAVNHRITHTPVAPIMVMLGGVLLRVVIVHAGQASHWSPI